MELESYAVTAFRPLRVNFTTATSRRFCQRTGHRDLLPVPMINTRPSVRPRLYIFTTPNTIYCLCPQLQSLPECSELSGAAVCQLSPHGTVVSTGCTYMCARARQFSWDVPADAYLRATKLAWWGTWKRGTQLCTVCLKFWSLSSPPPPHSIFMSIANSQNE